MNTRRPISRTRRNAESGTATMVILILLAIMLVFVMANTATVNWVRWQIKDVEKHQIQRLHNMEAAQRPVSK